MTYIQAMLYDFRKVQEAIRLSGKTLVDVERLTGINNGTISRILRTGKAHQRSALKLVNAFRLTMADIQKPIRARRTA